jgi:hypothetical protein
VYRSHWQMPRSPIADNNWWWFYVNVNEVDPVYLLGNIKAFWYSVLGIKKLAIVPGSQAFGVAHNWITTVGYSSWYKAHLHLIRIRASLLLKDLLWGKTLQKWNLDAAKVWRYRDSASPQGICQKRLVVVRNSKLCPIYNLRKDGYGSHVHRERWRSSKQTYDLFVNCQAVAIRESIKSYFFYYLSP